MVRSWVTGAVVLALWSAAAQATAHAIINDALSLEDVRRPVYRGNIRYNISFSHNFSRKVYEKEAGISMHSFNRIYSDVDSFYFIEENKVINDMHNDEEIKTFKNNKFGIRRKIREANPRLEKKIQEGKDGESWSLVQLVTDANQTEIVQKFLENSLNDLEKSQESLDKLILSHTEAPNKYIQMYPEGSPPHWYGSTPKPNVILVEDVHPSKLPKPEYSDTPLYQKPSHVYGSDIEPTRPSWTYGKPSTGSSADYSTRPSISKPSHYYEPVTQSPVTEPPHYNRPATKPISKPSHYYGPATKPPVSKPSHYYEPSNNYVPVTKPPVSKPSHYYQPTTRPPVSKPSHYYEPTSKPPVSKPSHYYESNAKPTVPRPSHYHEQYTNPTISKPAQYYEQENTKPPIQYDYPKPIVLKPAQEFSEPSTSVPLKPIRPTYIYPKPVTIKPAFEYGTEPSYRPVIATTHLQKPIIVTEHTPVSTKPPPEPPPPPRLPPPTIVVIDSPENHIDCGTVQIINSASWKDCPDVSVVLNSASSNTALSTVPPETHAAIVPVGTSNTGLSEANGVVPLPPPPLPSPPPRPPSSIIPVAQDDEYDDDDDDENDNNIQQDDPVSAIPTTPSTPKPSRPTSILGFLMNSLPFLGPISVSLWVIFLGPLSFILIGFMGVASFLFPWLAPGLIFGRLGRRSFNQKPKIPFEAKIFERDLHLGRLNDRHFRFSK